MSDKKELAERIYKTIRDRGYFPQINGLVDCEVGIFRERVIAVIDMELPEIAKTFPKSPELCADCWEHLCSTCQEICTGAMIRCPACGEVHHKTSNYCHDCGTRLFKEKPDPYILGLHASEILDLFEWHRNSEGWSDAEDSELLDYIKNKFDWTYVWDQVRNVGNLWIEEQEK